jgi:hypothetical protein
MDFIVSEDELIVLYSVSEDEKIDRLEFSNLLRTFEYQKTRRLTGWNSVNFYGL